MVNYNTFAKAVKRFLGIFSCIHVLEDFCIKVYNEELAFCYGSSAEGIFTCINLLLVLK